MASIWTAPASVFQTALASYNKALPPKPNLPQLEAYATQLRTKLASRSPKHITSAEYQKLITWKLSRGKWRPRLQKLADALGDDEIIPASESAFRHYHDGDDKAALRCMTQLKGCGPASASLVLSLVGACFMSDEIMMLALGDCKYTEKAFLQLQQAVRDKGTQLGASWNSWDIERAAYASVKLGISAEKRGREEKKRGREEKTQPIDADRKSEERPKEIEPDLSNSGLRRSKRIRNQNR